MSVYPFIEAEKVEQDGNVAMTCRLLEVSRAAYYEWSEHKPSRRRLSDAELAEKIEQVYVASRRTYGAPRVARQLRRNGVCVSQKRVARIMASEDSSGAASAGGRKRPSPIPKPKRQPTSSSAPSARGQSSSTASTSATSPIRPSSRLCAVGARNSRDRGGARFGGLRIIKGVRGKPGGGPVAGTASDPSSDRLGAGVSPLWR